MSIEEDNLKATLKHGRKVLKLIEPIRQYFGVQQMCFNNVLNNGHTVSVNSYPELHEFGTFTGSYKSNPHYVQPSSMGRGFAQWSAYPKCSEYQTWIEKMKQNFDVCQGITFIQHHANGYRVYSFSTGKDNPNFQSNILRDIDYLQNFIKYFYEKAHNIIDDIETNNWVDIASISQDHFYKSDGIIPVIKDRAKHLDFLTATGVLDLCIADVSLSRQEKRCIELLTNNTAKETAVIMKLSHRTVESYLENIKNKLNFDSKAEILEKKWALQKIGIL